MDNKVISGVHKLINLNNVESGVDIKKIEEDLLGDCNQDQIDENEYNKAVLEVQQKLGVNLSDSELESGSESSETDSATESETESDGSYSEDSDESNNSDESSDESSDDSSESDNEIYKKTKEGKKNRRIHDVMKSMNIRPSVGGYDQMRSEDSKISMIEEIDFLRNELLETGNDITGIPPITQKSNYDSVESTLRLLRFKSDRLKYSKFAEDFLMMGIYAVETAFDGDRNWFGYKPDLTGWATVVAPKLRRMRHETSEMAAEFLNGNNINGIPRIMLELVPSAVVYSKQKKDAKSENNDEITKSINNLRDLE